MHKIPFRVLHGIVIAMHRENFDASIVTLSNDGKIEDKFEVTCPNRLCDDVGKIRPGAGFKMHINNKFCEIIFDEPRQWTDKEIKENEVQARELFEMLNPDKRGME